MNKLKRTYVQLVVLFLVLNPILATAQKPDGSCNEVVQECNAAIKAADELVDAQNLLIENQKQQISTQLDITAKMQKGYDLEKQRADAWYRDPFVVIPVSIVIGFVAAQALEKR